MKNKETYNTESEEALDFEGVTGLNRMYLFQPYTFHRIKRILKEHFGWELDNIWQGYKANRRPGYHELYRVVRIDTKEVICGCTSLHTLRKVLARQGFPLEDEKSASRTKKPSDGLKTGTSKPARNKGAERFLELVRAVSDSRKGDSRHEQDSRENNR